MDDEERRQILKDVGRGQIEASITALDHLAHMMALEATLFALDHRAREIFDQQLELERDKLRARRDEFVELLRLLDAESRKHLN